MIRHRIHKSIQTYDNFIAFLETWLTDVLLLVMRVYIASIFFQAGWNKLKNLWEGGWQKTVFLFTTVHPVPHLSPEVAAFLGTWSEVIFSVMLALGIMARMGALGLLGVTAVITFGVHSHFTHVFWGLLLGVSLIMGPGKFSFDEGIRSWWTRLHTRFLAHLEAQKIINPKAPYIEVNHVNCEIMLDNRKEPIVNVRLSKRKLVTEPEQIVKVKSIIRYRKSKFSQPKTFLSSN